MFRAPIVVKGIEPCVKNWEKPITLARHAYGEGTLLAHVVLVIIAVHSVLHVDARAYLRELGVGLSYLHQMPCVEALVAVNHCLHVNDEELSGLVATDCFILHVVSEYVGIAVGVVRYCFPISRRYLLYLRDVRLCPHRRCRAGRASSVFLF